MVHKYSVELYFELNCPLIKHTLGLKKSGKSKLYIKDTKVLNCL